MATTSPKSGKKFSLGGVSAEADELLEEAFYETSDFETISSRLNKRCFVVGRTGSGKSAVLNRLEDLCKEDVIRINPENLAFPYITNLDIIRRSNDLNVNLDLFWSVLWKHVLLVEIIRHRYKVNSADAKTNIFQGMHQRFKSDPTKRKALEYLEEFQDRFWEDTDVRIRTITEGLTKKIDESGKVGAKISGLEVGAGVESANETFIETRKEEADRYQRVVNENQLPRLNAMIDELNDYILQDDQNFTYIIIDDLDLYWVDETIVTDLIRVLFQTVFELKKVRNLKILVALRTNMFQELDFGKHMAGQEEKFRGLVVDMKWSPHDLEAMLDERVAVSSTRIGSRMKSFTDILPNSNARRGKPLDYIFQRTLYRPRDAITFANECFEVGIGKLKLAWTDIQTAEEKYSRNMLLSLRDEWKATYPGIDQLVEKFRSSPMRMTPEQIALILDDAALLLSDLDFKGIRWLTDVTNPIWISPPGENDFAVYQGLLEVLFSIGLIGCATYTSGEPIFYYDDSLYVTRKSTFEKIKYFNVHRAYQLGLEIHPKAEIS